MNATANLGLFTLACLTGAVPAAGAVWPSEPPADCPFPASADAHRHRLHWPSCGIHRRRYVVSVVGGRREPVFAVDRWQSQRAWLQFQRHQCHTGNAKIIGDEPLHLQVVDQGVYVSDPSPYAGRYPCGSLVYKGVWYYGTYCLHPNGTVPHDGMNYNGPGSDPLSGSATRQTSVRPGSRRLARRPKPLFGENGPPGRARQDRLAALRGFRQEPGAFA